MKEQKTIKDKNGNELIVKWEGIESFVKEGTEIALKIEGNEIAVYYEAQEDMIIKENQLIYSSSPTDCLLVVKSIEIWDGKIQLNCKHQEALSFTDVGLYSEIY